MLVGLNTAIGPPLGSLTAEGPAWCPQHSKVSWFYWISTAGARQALALVKKARLPIDLVLEVFEHVSDAVAKVHLQELAVSPVRL